MSEENGYDYLDDRPLEAKTDKPRSEVSAEEGRATAMLRTEFKRYLSEQVTYVNDGVITKEEYYRRGAQWLKDKQITDDGVEFCFELMRRHLKFQRIPYGALASAVDLARVYVKRYEGKGVYPDWVSPKKRVLYVLMFILGAYGRYFQFACDAIAKETGIDSKSVWHFRQDCEEFKIIYAIDRGLSFGRATMYFLIQNDDAWEDLGMLLVGKSDPSGDTIKEHCPWLFDLSNLSNKYAWESYQTRRKGWQREARSTIRK